MGIVEDEEFNRKRKLKALRQKQTTGPRKRAKTETEVNLTDLSDSDQTWCGTKVRLISFIITCCQYYNAFLHHKLHHFRFSLFCCWSPSSCHLCCSSLTTETRTSSTSVGFSSQTEPQSRSLSGNTTGTSPPPSPPPPPPPPTERRKEIEVQPRLSSQRGIIENIQTREENSNNNSDNSYLERDIYVQL